MPILSRFPFSLLCLVLNSSLAHAQTPPPDAGSLRQQIERQQIDRPLPERGTRLDVEQSATGQRPDGSSLTVQSFRFAGTTLLGNEQLQAVVQPWLNRPIGFADLQRATAAVASSYRDAGWLAFAYLAQQDVTDGVVTIQVTEAQFSGARIEGTEGERLKSSIALQHVEQQVGQPLSARLLDRSLLLVDDLPGVSISGALSPGGRPGETELLLSLGDDRLIDGTARIDTGGARFTGEERLLLTMRINSPQRIGDSVVMRTCKRPGISSRSKRPATPLAAS